MSNTATCGTPGIAAIAARMPSRFAGLCSGASGMSASISASTSGVMTVAFVNRSPPCTTR